MRLGKINLFLFILLFFKSFSFVFADDKIQSVPLINLEDLSPTFEEDKSELEKMEEANITSNKDDNTPGESKMIENDKIYINLTALDKITAKTSSLRLAVGDKKFFGSEIFMPLKMFDLFFVPLKFSLIFSTFNF